MMKILLPAIGLVVFRGKWGYLAGIVSFMGLSCVLVVLTVAPYSGSVGLLVDELSVLLVLLSVWVTSLMLLVSGSTAKLSSLSLFRSLMCALCFCLIFSFFAGSLFSFYVFFEFSLIPITLMVMGWGYQPERLQASYYLVLYTVSASLPLLVCVCFLHFCGGHVCFYLGNWASLVGLLSVDLWWFVMILAFLVKTPMFYVHLWLPKAHVESPLTGSMILAGVLLKLGGYGIIRLMSFYSGVSYLPLGFCLSVVSVWGGMLCGFICLRQTDLKALIAYSSITHMGVMLGGLFSGSYLGLMGGVLTMVSHGLVSSFLFQGAYSMYKILGTRSVYMLKGFMGIMPLFSLLWFLGVSANMGAPPTLNLVGEVLLVVGVVKVSKVFLLILGVSLFVSAAYSLFAFVSTQGGDLVGSDSGFYTLLLSDCVSAFFHLFPSFIMLVVVNSLFFGVA